MYNFLNSGVIQCNLDIRRIYEIRKNYRYNEYAWYPKVVGIRNLQAQFLIYVQGGVRNDRVFDLLIKSLFQLQY
jgi:TATA-box binding protein (TBP) (component of TFIID and TFIIIB)